MSRRVAGRQTAACFLKELTFGKGPCPALSTEDYATNCRNSVRLVHITCKLSIVEHKPKSILHIKATCALDMIGPVQGKCWFDRLYAIVSGPKARGGAEEMGLTMAVGLVKKLIMHDIREMIRRFT